MKKIIYIFGFLTIVLGFAGCDYIYTPKTHYVSIYNDESDKYITAVYFRDNFYEGDRWSKNVVGSYIYPYEYLDIIMDEGTYDFKAYMEDDYYSYEIDILEVYVYSNIDLNICYSCYDNNTKVNVIRTPKSNIEKE